MYLMIVSSDDTDPNSKCWINNPDDTHYLYADGVLRVFKEVLYTKGVYHASRELAQEALDRYNKGNGMFTKKDLKNGMLVKLKGYDILAKVSYVGSIGGWGLAYNGGTHIHLDEYTQDLTLISSNKEYTIEAIYDVPSKPLYVRQAPVSEYTIEQLEAKLGHKIKVVGGTN